MGLNLIKLQVGGHNLCGLNVTNVFINRLKKISQKKFGKATLFREIFFIFYFCAVAAFGFCVARGRVTICGA